MPAFNDSIEFTIYIPGRGDISRVEVVYSVPACKEWLDGVKRTVLAPFQAEATAIATERETIVTAWNAAVDALTRAAVPPADLTTRLTYDEWAKMVRTAQDGVGIAATAAINAQYSPQVEALRPRADALARQMHQAAIDSGLVLGVTWPFDPPVPTPGDAASWAVLPNLVLTWIAENGVKAAAESWADPN